VEASNRAAKSSSFSVTSQDTARFGTDATYNA
jgi:hypothetical protein